MSLQSICEILDKLTDDVTLVASRVKHVIQTVKNIEEGSDVVKDRDWRLKKDNNTNDATG